MLDRASRVKLSILNLSFCSILIFELHGSWWMPVLEAVGSHNGL